MHTVSSSTLHPFYPQEHVEEAEQIRQDLEQQSEELWSTQGALEESDRARNALEDELNRLNLEAQAEANKTMTSVEKFEHAEELRVALEHVETENQALEQDVKSLQFQQQQHEEDRATMLQQNNELRRSLQEAEDVMLYGRPVAVAEEMARLQADKKTLMGQVEELVQKLFIAESAVDTAMESESDTRKRIEEEAHVALQRMEASYKLRLEAGESKCEGRQNCPRLPITFPNLPPLLPAAVDASKELEAIHADRGATTGQELAQLEATRGRMQGQISGLEKLVESYETTNARLNEDKAVLAEDLEALSKKHAQTIEELAAANAGRDQAEQAIIDCDRLEAALSEREELLAQTEQKLDEQTRKLAQIEEEVDEARAALKVSDINAVKVREEANRKLELQLQLAEQQREQASTMSEDSEAAAEQARDQANMMRKMEEAHRKLEDELADAKADNNQLVRASQLLKREHEDKYASMRRSMAAEHEEATRRALEDAAARLDSEAEAKIATITDEANRRVEEMTSLTASTRLAAITATAAALDVRQQQALGAALSSPADIDTQLLQRMGSDISDGGMLYDPANASPVPPSPESAAPTKQPSSGDEQAARKMGEMAKEMFSLFSTWDEYQPVMAYANVVRQAEDVLTNVAELEARWRSQPDLPEQGQLRAKAMRIHALRVVMCYLKSQVINLSKKEHADLKRKVDRCYDSKSAAGLIKEGYQVSLLRERRTAGYIQLMLTANMLASLPNIIARRVSRRWCGGYRRVAPAAEEGGWTWEMIG